MTLVIVTGSPVLRRMPELGFHAAQNVIDVSTVVALLCALEILKEARGLSTHPVVVSVK